MLGDGCEGGGTKRFVLLCVRGLAVAGSSSKKLLVLALGFNWVASGP